jgi:hypothetical protein
MSNYNVPINTACCDSGEEGFPLGYVAVIALTVFSLVIVVPCSLIAAFVRLREKLALQVQLQAQLEEDVASQNRKAERRSHARRNRKESLSNGLIVKEWVPPDDAPVGESTKGDQDTSPSGEVAEATHSLAPSIDSSPVSCAMGSDDYDSLVGDGEMADCAICLSHFKPQQLVCESNNPSCRHIFHKDCMVDWLMKHHHDCPLCREVYILKIFW